MTIGTQPGSGNIDNTLTQLAIELRNVMQDWLNLSAYVTSIGTAGLEVIGYSPAQAAAVEAVTGNMATLAQIYQGTPVGLPLPFNFSADTEPLWAGG